jgi:hypothetical protein
LTVLATAVSAACTGSRPDPLVGTFGEDIVDYGESVAHRYWLRQGAGAPIPLHFAEAPDVPPGTTIAVWGAAAGAGGALQVERFEARSSGDEAVRSALVGGEPRPARRWAFVLVDTGSGVKLTKDAIRDQLFSTSSPTSIRNWYREVSYGIQDLDGDVFGPLSYPDTSCNEDDLANTLRPMVQGTFDQYLWYIGRALKTCNWGGIGTLGTAVRPERDSWYNAYSDCYVLIQETGHNFGMLHSSSMRCTVGGKPVPFSASPQQDCKHNEYGNPFDPMGTGCFHTNGYQKSYLNWISGCNVVTVKSSGVFTLFPIEQSCDGTQLLQVPMPAPRPFRAVSTGIPERMSSLTDYYLELRTPVGWDAQLMPRVLVTIGGALKEAKRSGGRNWLLDMKPETTTRQDAALAVGQTFADPDPMGPRITLLSVDATKATIRIELAGDATAGADAAGMGECEDGTTVVGSTEATCAAAPPPNVSDGGTAGDGGRSRRDAGGAGNDGEAAGGTGDAAPLASDAAEPEQAADAAPDHTRASATAADASPVATEEPDADPTLTPPRVVGGCACRAAGENRASSRSGTVLAASLLLLALARARRA